MLWWLFLLALMAKTRMSERFLDYCPSAQLTWSTLSDPWIACLGTKVCMFFPDLLKVGLEFTISLNSLRQCSGGLWCTKSFYNFLSQFWYLDWDLTVQYSPTLDVRNPWICLPLWATWKSQHQRVTHTINDCWSLEVLAFVELQPRDAFQKYWQQVPQDSERYLRQSNVPIKQFSSHLTWLLLPTHRARWTGHSTTNHSEPDKEVSEVSEPVHLTLAFSL